MTALTPAQLLFLHHRLIVTTGGNHGLCDLGALQAAAARPQATLNGVELYPDPFAKAAALFESLIRNHPFVDGNKRTAIAAAGLLLQRNGYRMTTGQDELYAFTMLMATEVAGQTEARQWLAAHTQPLR